MMMPAPPLLSCLGSVMMMPAPPPLSCLGSVMMMLPDWLLKSSVSLRRAGFRSPTQLLNMRPGEMFVGGPQRRRRKGGAGRDPFIGPALPRFGRCAAQGTHSPCQGTGWTHNPQAVPGHRARLPIALLCRSAAEDRPAAKDAPPGGKRGRPMHWPTTIDKQGGEVLRHPARLMVVRGAQGREKGKDLPTPFSCCSCFNLPLVWCIIYGGY